MLCGASRSPSWIDNSRALVELIVPRRLYLSAADLGVLVFNGFTADCAVCGVELQTTSFGAWPLSSHWPQSPIIASLTDLTRAETEGSLACLLGPQHARCNKPTASSPSCTNASWPT